MAIRTRVGHSDPPTYKYMTIQNMSSKHILLNIYKCTNKIYTSKFVNNYYT